MFFLPAMFDSKHVFVCGGTNSFASYENPSLTTSCLEGKDQDVQARLGGASQTACPNSAAAPRVSGGLGVLIVPFGGRSCSDQPRAQWLAWECLDLLGSGAYVSRSVFCCFSLSLYHGTLRSRNKYIEVTAS